MARATIRSLAALLVIVGALNWGLVAIAEYDLVAEIFGEEFGETNAASRIVYGLVGIAGLVLAATMPWGGRQPVRERERTYAR